MDSIKKIRVAREVLEEHLEGSELGFFDVLSIKHVLEHVLPQL